MRSLAVVSATLLGGALPACGTVHPGAAAMSTSPAPATPMVTTTVGIGYQYAGTSGTRVGILLPDGTRHEITVAANSPDASGWVDLSATDGGVVANAGGHLTELEADGSSRDLGAAPAAIVPPSSESGFAVSPDGTEIAYATSIPGVGGTLDNRLYVAPIGGTPRLLAERTTTPNPTAMIAPGADSPELWEYQVRRWTRQGILVVRSPENVGGGGPFLSYDWFTAIVDPRTGDETDLTRGKETPLNSYSDTGRWVTVDWANAGAGGQYGDATPVALEVGALDGQVRRYPVDGSALAGDGVLDTSGERVAYATLDTAAWESAEHANSGANWNVMYQLHILDLRTGRSHTVGPLGLDPIAWTAAGQVIAQRPDRGEPLGAVTYVSVDPATGAVRTLASPSSPWSTVVVTAPPA